MERICVTDVFPRNIKRVLQEGDGKHVRHM
jgi:hypothetical protein